MNALILLGALVRFPFIRAGANGSSSAAYPITSVLCPVAAALADGVVFLTLVLPRC